MGEKDKGKLYIDGEELGEVTEMPELKYEYEDCEPLGRVVGIGVNESSITIHVKPKDMRVWRRIFTGINNWRKLHGLPMYRKGAAERWD